jgi:hypothetical protein
LRDQVVTYVKTAWFHSKCAQTNLRRKCPQLGKILPVTSSLSWCLSLAVFVSRAPSFTLVCVHLLCAQDTYFDPDRFAERLVEMNDSRDSIQGEARAGDCHTFDMAKPIVEAPVLVASQGASTPKCAAAVEGSACVCGGRWGREREGGLGRECVARECSLSHMLGTCLSPCHAVASVPVSAEGRRHVAAMLGTHGAQVAVGRACASEDV